MNYFFAMFLGFLVALGVVVAKDDPQKILDRLPKETIIERDGEIHRTRWKIDQMQ